MIRNEIRTNKKKYSIIKKFNKYMCLQLSSRAPVIRKWTELGETVAQQQAEERAARDRAEAAEVARREAEDAAAAMRRQLDEACSLPPLILNISLAVISFTPPPLPGPPPLL